MKIETRIKAYQIYYGFMPSAFEIQEWKDELEGDDDYEEDIEDE